MSSDELIREVGRVAREDAAAEVEDARWDKLARGELTAAEVDEIRRQAEGDPDIAAMYEAFRPLGDDAKSRIVDRIVTGEPKAKVIPIGRWRRAALVAVPLAAAAAVALWLARPAHDGEVASIDAIPEYALAVTGGDRPTRSGDAPASGPLEVHRDSRLELVLRPAKAVSGAVAARGFLAQGAVTRPWSPPMEISSDGSIRVAGRAGDLLGVPAGAWDVVLVVGRASELPSDPEVVSRAVADRAGARPWRLFVTRVKLDDGP